MKETSKKTEEEQGRVQKGRAGAEYYSPALLGVSGFCTRERVSFVHSPLLACSDCFVGTRDGGPQPHFASLLVQLLESVTSSIEPPLFDLSLIDL